MSKPKHAYPEVKWDLLPSKHHIAHDVINASLKSMGLLRSKFAIFASFAIQSYEYKLKSKFS